MEEGKRTTISRSFINNTQVLKARLLVQNQVGNDADCLMSRVRDTNNINNTITLLNSLLSGPPSNQACNSTAHDNDPASLGS